MKTMLDLDLEAHSARQELKAWLDKAYQSFDSAKYKTHLFKCRCEKGQFWGVPLATLADSLTAATHCYNHTLLSFCSAHI